MYNILLSVHVVVCIMVVLIVLVQAGRSGGLSGLMGASSGDAIFSTSAQQSGLRKFTLILACIFMATSFGLTILSSRRQNVSVFQQQFPSLPPIQQQSAPATQQPADPVIPQPVGGEQQK
jgi:preprotein translocase subunit SecG